MTAKLGGIPWAMNELPFVDRPTVVVGIDVYHRTFNGVRKSIFAFVATMNITFSRFFFSSFFFMIVMQFNSIKILFPCQDLRARIRNWYIY